MKIDTPRIPQALTPLDDPASMFVSELDITAVSISDTFLTSEDLEAHSINESTFSRVDFTGVEAERLSISDTTLKACVFSACKFSDSDWTRVAIASSRCAGMEMIESVVRNVSFSDSKIEFINFRKAKLENVLFKDCSMTDVDFNEASLKNVRFENCDLTDVTFTGAKMNNVNIAHSRIEHIKGIESIRGVTISSEQLMLLAPSMAGAAGIKIEDESAR